MRKSERNSRGMRVIKEGSGGNKQEGKSWKRNPFHYHFRNRAGLAFGRDSIGGWLAKFKRNPRGSLQCLGQLLERRKE